jgi:hypothetical protein
MASQYNKEKKRAYYEKNKILITTKKKVYREANLDKDKIAKRAWYLRNKEKVKAASRARHEAYREEANTGRGIRYKAAHAVDPRIQMLRAAKDRAKKNGKEFSLTVEDIFIPSVCPILKIPLFIGRKGNANSPSLDRIDSSKGYVAENVAVISYRANMIKNNATLEELEAITNYVRNALTWG